MVDIADIEQINKEYYDFIAPRFNYNIIVYCEFCQEKYKGYYFQNHLKTFKHKENFKRICEKEKFI